MPINQRDCEACKGVGLVSTGADQNDLNSGSKVVCLPCGGTGKVDDVSNGDSQPESGASEPQGEESPKDPAPADETDTSGASGTPSATGIEDPKVGDACVTSDDKEGTLGRNENGEWVCNPTELA